MKKIIFSTVILIFILSCKSENISNSSLGLIEVAISGATFNSEVQISNRAATEEKINIQRNTTELNADFLMVAELHPHDPTPKSLTDASKAAIETSDIATNVRYRLLVFTQAGAFVAERDYIRGQEASTEALQLDGGTTYTFVAVSLNLTTELPATTPAIATRTLANSRITTAAGVNALMYYRQTLTVSGNSINRLDILFQHKKARINVTLNAEQTGYNITQASGRFDPHNNGMIVNLSDGTRTLSGSNVGVNVLFDNVGSQIITNSSNSFINSLNNSETIFTLNSLTIGPLTLTNLVPFENLTVTDGVRYNLIINIVPRDDYLTYQGIPAARINGRIWALHNLGVDNTLPHNPATITSALHGNYYQFGRNAITAGPTSTTTNNNFNATYANTNAWNLGTETAVSKNNTNDPCPTGFRLPTRTDMEQLLDGVVVTRRGSFTNSATNYGSAAILTSKRNSNVVLALPAQGFINVTSTNPPTPLNIDTRGSSVNYWTSSAPAQNDPYRLLISNTTEAVGIPTGTTNFAQSRPIRCTAAVVTQTVPQS